MNRLGFISANNYSDPYPVYPIGVSYLTTYLGEKMPECEISLFDFNLDGSYEELERWCADGGFDVVAISLRNIDDNNIYSDNFFVVHYKRIVATVKSVTDVVTVVGGPGFSIFPVLLYEELGVDFGIRGEGERSLHLLLESIFGGKTRTDIDGLVFREVDGTVKVNGRTEFISSPSLKMNPSSVPFYFEKSGMLNVQTKRGCPFHCIFCSYPLIDGRRVRTLDADKVVDNIREMNMNHNVDYLFFTDSVFNIDREYNEELCNKIIESGIKIRWGAYFSPSSLTERELELYKRSGLTHIEWGTDTLADRTLETYGKTFSWEQIRTTSKLASDLGIFYAHFMILGGYGETDETLDQTFERSRELGMTVMFPYIGMRVYPETPLFDRAVEEGIVKEASDVVAPVYYVSRDVTVETIKGRAKASGQKWIFPEDNNSPLIERFRKKHRRGPLWEYLRY